MMLGPYLMTCRTYEAVEQENALVSGLSSLPHKVAAIFSVYYLFVACTTIRSAHEGHLDTNAGLPYEDYVLVISVLCVWLLVQATVALRRVRPSSKFEMTAFPLSMLFTMCPFLADPFDILKDSILAAFCIISTTLFLNIIGVCLYIYNFFLYIYLIYSFDDSCSDMANTFLAAYLSPLKVKSFRLWSTALRDDTSGLKMKIALISYKQ